MSTLQLCHWALCLRRLTTLTVSLIFLHSLDSGWILQVTFFGHILVNRNREKWGYLFWGYYSDCIPLSKAMVIVIWRLSHNYKFCWVLLKATSPYPFKPKEGRSILWFLVPGFFTTPYEFQDLPKTLKSFFHKSLFPFFWCAISQDHD